MSNHLIHIGFPKAASTFLQEWFHQHPQLHYSRGKLAGFQDAFEICHFASSNTIPSPAYFVTSTEYFTYPDASIGLTASANSSKTDFFKTINYKEPQKKTCITLKELFPGSKILIITRGYRGAILSSYSQFIKIGGRLTVAEFCKLIELNNDLFFNYNYLIGLYLQYFGKDNVVVLPYELLLHNKQNFLTHLEGVLGLEHFDENIGPRNKSLTDQELFWYLRLSILMKNLFNKLGEKPEKKLYAKYVDLLLQNRLKGPVNFLKAIMPNKIIEKKIPEEILSNSGKYATILKNYPIFTPYLKDYCLPDSSQ